ncbi:hypothetical protein JAO76_02560 [Pontibacter sp. BT310]|uniref:TerB family tellurite resistance protein n=1 Tax=Pontibacter populi TaxID=890055 RepID=A0ABS6X8C1_9BACT|nr:MULTISPECIES: hypothetical protein [Pontibacter]MBJ6117056.1 hypothetical protein [Pontibacter sp. BT310]MBR0569480.1 hypothetical protein [Microvirga sp. STS03]MBW3363909.1 hypothetical protein [Pontibacter populi]
MKNYNWQQTDTQFLEALLLATGGDGSAPLQEVLLMADALDGTIFTLKEVEENLLKLVAAEVVSINKNKLSLNPEFLQQYEALTLQEGLTENDNLLMNLLQQQTITEETIKAAKDGELKKYKLQNHYQAYQEQFGS